MAKQVILYPGSFNPVHNGHLTVAEGVLDCTGADALWFVVSPHNPFKQGGELAPEGDRLEMVRLAIGTSPRKERMEACEIEFQLPKPTFTVRTLRLLSERHPDVRFSLLIGSDNVDDFDKWKEYEYILTHYPVLVYPREGYEPHHTALMRRFTRLDNVRLMPQAATAIREHIEKNDTTAMWRDGTLPAPVWEYIEKHGLYGCKS